MRWLIVFFLLIAPFHSSLSAQEKKTTEQTQNQPQPIPRRFTPEKEMKKVVTNAKEQPEKNSGDSDTLLEQETPPLLTQGLAIIVMALSPFLVMLLSPFMKIVVVLSLLRTALGVQNSPPNAVINGIAIMLSLFIMYPVATDMYNQAKPVIEKTEAPDSIMAKGTPEYILAIVNASKEPFRDYLVKNSLVTHQRMFYRMIYRHVPQAERPNLSPQDFIVLVPSFITGQLKAAFEIGVLIYIPFFVIDMVVSNILLAMGMMMLSPVTISMPLKLFLLVMLDGWSILIEGLVNTFKTGVS
jgi:type III secretion protein R